MNTRKQRALVLLLLIAASTSMIAITGSFAESPGTPDPGSSDAGSARLPVEQLGENELLAPTINPMNWSTRLDDLVLWPLQSAEGVLLGSFTDGARGRAPQPLNTLEQTKLEMMRRAVAAAEAAGNRMVTPLDPPAGQVPDAAAQKHSKLERLAAATPQPMASRPGVPAAGPTGAITSSAMEPAGANTPSPMEPPCANTPSATEPAGANTSTPVDQPGESGEKEVDR
jgi:hypothetical protein